MLNRVKIIYIEKENLRECQFTIKSTSHLNYVAKQKKLLNCYQIKLSHLKLSHYYQSTIRNDNTIYD